MESSLRVSCFVPPLVSREWKNGRNSSHNCTPFLRSLVTKGKLFDKPKPPNQYPLNPFGLRFGEGLGLGVTGDNFGPSIAGRRAEQGSASSGVGFGV